jgi:hypothetical protein
LYTEAGFDLTTCKLRRQRRYHYIQKATYLKNLGYRKAISSRHCQTLSDSIHTFPDVVMTCEKAESGPELETSQSKDTATMSVPLIINTEFVDNFSDKEFLQKNNTSQSYIRTL